MTHSSDQSPATDVPTGKPLWDADDYLARGIFAAIVAAVLLAIAVDTEADWATVVGWIVAVVAGLLLTIGIVAKGVEVGHR